MRIIIGGVSVEALAMREVTRIMSSFEYWDLFNRNRVWVRNHHKRGDRIPDGLYHIVVHSWVMDYYGNFLILQRQKVADGCHCTRSRPVRNIIGEE